MLAVSDQYKGHLVHEGVGEAMIRALAMNETRFRDASFEVNSHCPPTALSLPFTELLF